MKTVLLLAVLLGASVQASAGTFACEQGQTWIEKITVDVNQARGCNDNGNLTATYNGIEYCVSNVSQTDLIAGIEYQMCATFEEEQLTVTRAEPFSYEE